jgi:hypothetical protein
MTTSFVIVNITAEDAESAEEYNYFGKAPPSRFSLLFTSPQPLSFRRGAENIP